MERYVLIVYSATDFYLFPVNNFVGGIFLSATTTKIYFEKAPMSYSFDFTHETGRGSEFLRSLGDLLNNSPENVIEFNVLTSSFATDYVTAVSTGTKVVIK